MAKRSIQITHAMMADNHQSFYPVDMPFSEDALRQSAWVEIVVGWPKRADLVIVVVYDSRRVRAGYDESPGIFWKWEYARSLV